MRRSVLRAAPGTGVRDLVRVLADSRLLAGAPALVRAVRVDGGSLSAVVRAGAARFGERPALIDEHGRLGYAELERLVGEAAGGLAAGQRVGVLCREPRWVLVAAAAASRAGADAVLIGPGTGRTELAGLVERERIDLLLHDGPVEGSAVARREPPFLGTPATAGRRSGRLVLLSSGTTGRPTGTARPGLGPRQALTVASLIRCLALRPGDPVLVLPPLHHGHGLSLAIACLLVGAPIVAGGPDPVELLARHRVAVVSGVPTQLHRLAEALAGDDRPLPHLRRVVSGSARLPPAVAERLTERLGPVLVDLYGTTETGTLTRAGAGEGGTVGRPVAGVRIRVVDELGRSVARGVEGAVLARSPFAPVESPTGDRGLVDRRGRLVITGRADDLIVSGGENISAVEVEDHLRAQPEVDDVHVRVESHPEFDRVLVASVVLRAPVDPEELRSRVARDLARHKAPRRIEIVDTIPRTETGKAVER